MGIPWAEMQPRTVTQTELEQPQENGGIAWIGDPKDTPREPGEELADVLHTHLPQCWSWEGTGVLKCGQAWARGHLQVLTSTGERKYHLWLSKEGKGQAVSSHPGSQTGRWLQVLQHLSITPKVMVVPQKWKP